MVPTNGVSVPSISAFSRLLEWIYIKHPVAILPRLSSRFQTQLLRRYRPPRSSDHLVSARSLRATQVEYISRACIHHCQCRSDEEWLRSYHIRRAGYLTVDRCRVCGRRASYYNGDRRRADRRCGLSRIVKRWPPFEEVVESQISVGVYKGAVVNTGPAPS